MKTQLLMAWLALAAPVAASTISVDFERFVSDADNDLTQFFEPSLFRVSSVESRLGKVVIPSDSEVSNLIFAQMMEFSVGSVFELSFDFLHDPTIRNRNKNWRVASVIFERLSGGSWSPGLTIENGQFMPVMSESPPSTIQRFSVVEAPGWYRFIVSAQHVGGTFGDEWNVSVELRDSLGLVLGRSSGKHFYADLANPGRVRAYAQAAPQTGLSAVDNVVLSGPIVDAGEPRFFEASINPAVQLRWDSYPDRRYVVERTESLENPDWKPVAGPLRATSSVTIHYVPIAAASEGFFRIREE